MSSTTATNTRVELLRRIVQDARQVLDGTMADVTQAQVDYIPPGIATPLVQRTRMLSARRTWSFRACSVRLHRYSGVRGQVVPA